MRTSDGGGSRAYLVERYVTGITGADVADAAARTDREAVVLRNGGADVRRRCSWLIPGDEAVLCLFEAGSAEVVRELHRRAGIGVSRVVEIAVFPAQASGRGPVASKPTRRGDRLRREPDPKEEQ